MSIKIQVLDGMLYTPHVADTYDEMEEILYRKFYAHEIYPISIGLDGDKSHDVINAMDLSRLKEFLDKWPKSDCYGMLEVPLGGYDDIAETRLKKFRR